MKRIRTWIVSLGAAALIGVVFYSYAAESSTSSNAESAAAAKTVREAPEIGAYAPDFALTGMDGQAYSLHQFRGKPVVLNFWASWCGPCKEEAPNFVKLQKELGSRVQIVAVNLTAGDSEKSAREFAAKYGFDFPVPLDDKSAAADRYRIRPIPTTFFIDANGVIQDGVLGALSWDDLSERTERLLDPSSS